MTNGSTYYVYIVQCANGHLYTGITTDTTRRVAEHNGEIDGGARYTRAHRPVVLRHTEAYSSRSAALKREHEIKQLRRSAKLSLIGAV